MGGGSSYSEAIDDLRAFGAPDEVIEEVLELQRGEDFEVWPENWAAVEMFLRLETQWRTGFDCVLGLDYNAARWLFEMYSPDDPRELFEAVTVMEKAALPLLNERPD